MIFRKRFQRRFITGCLLATCTLPIVASAQGGPVLPVREGYFSLQLAADKGEYSVGEAIKLRLTMTNTSDGNLIVDLEPPSGLTELEVRDETGQIVAPSPPGRAGGRGSMAANYKFAPAQSVIAEFYPPNGAAPVQWQDITWWGYSITKPGVYTIVAIPKFRGFQSAPTGAGAFTVSEKGRSNVVRIKIAP